jgi:hypothetical protein
MMHELTLDDAVIGHRKLRAVRDAADTLREQADALLQDEEYPGIDGLVVAARELEDRVRWVLGGRELSHKIARAELLLEHGTRVVGRLLKAIEHEAEEQDTAEGWIRRVSAFREALSAHVDGDIGGDIE